MLKEFKPTILFLVKFFGIYLLFSFLYGIYISKYDTASPAETDPITTYITVSCGRTASIFGYEPSYLWNDHLNAETKSEVTYDSISLDGIYAISVEEGCNGVNIIILFIAFIVAFGGKLVNMLVFIPAGILFVHVSNIGRLLLLSLLNVEWGGRAFHFFHKYGFTAVIYLSVLLLWYLWVVRFSGKSFKKKSTEE